MKQIKILFKIYFNKIIFYKFFTIIYNNDLNYFYFNCDSLIFDIINLNIF